MSEKLSDRLRAYAENCATIKGGADLIAAADALDAKDAEIAAQAAEIKRLRKALETAKNLISAIDAQSPRRNPAGYLTDKSLWADRAISTIDEVLQHRAALEPKP